MPSRHESSARADYVPALCTHRRRYYRLNGSVRPPDWRRRVATTPPRRKAGQTRSFRGSKSRNKVSVGEPAEGSLPSEGPPGGPDLPPVST
ncbi:hypothetical protein P175DRAFT_0179335, partial [Aspergillus ochraceoroseus IBT 24754]